MELIFAYGPPDVAAAIDVVTDHAGRARIPGQSHAMLRRCRAAFRSGLGEGRVGSIAVERIRWRRRFRWPAALKLTVNDALCPAVRVSGSESPLTVNSEVLMLALETVMLDPVAVSEAVKLLLCPTVTLPKLSVAGLTASWPGTVAVPARVMVSMESEASETTDNRSGGAAAGSWIEAAPKVKLCPGLRVKRKIQSGDAEASA